MTQLAIEFTPRARAGDPMTSIIAGRNAEKFRFTHADIIVATLEQHGRMTPKEMTDKCKLSFHQIDRRIKELMTARRIRYTGTDRDGCREFEVAA